MKTQLLFFLLMYVIGAKAQNQNPGYDSSLAVKLGADEYGMKSYVLVILKTGSNSSTDKAFVSKCFAGHMKNIQALVAQRKMFLAGPIQKNDKTYRGIFILNTDNFEEASKFLMGDDAVREKLLEPEYYHWYGSAALGEYLDEAESIRRKEP